MPIPAASPQAGKLLTAYEAAYRTDPVSAFGGIIAFNRELDAATARSIIGRQFAEVITAPGVSAAAPRGAGAEAGHPGAGGGAGGPRGCRQPTRRCRNAQHRRRPAGADRAIPHCIGAAGLKVVTRRAPTAQEMADLRFAWRVCKFVKSNAIVFARGGATLGVGAGQMSRVYSTRDRGVEGRG